MKVLYADDNIQIRNYVSMILESGLDCEIFEASSGNEALSFLEYNSQIDFIISEVKMKGGNGELIINYLDRQKLNLPIVWLSDGENKEIMIVQEVLARSPVNAFIPKPFRDDQFFPVIDRIMSLTKSGTWQDVNSDEIRDGDWSYGFKNTEEDAGYSLKGISKYGNSSLKKKKESSPQKRGKENQVLEENQDHEKFRKIRVKRFFNFKSVCCDVYIKIGGSKYLKLINANDPYEEGIIQKYIMRGSKYFYIRDEHYEKFQTQFSELVFSKLEMSQNLSDEVKGIAQLAAFENTLSLAREFGVTKNIAHKVRRSVKANIETLSQMPSLDKVLKRIMRGGDYISEHSLLLSFFAGQICMATSWGKKAHILEKMSMAALFHDIGLEKNKWAKIHSLEKAKEMGLSKEEIELIRSHPGLGAKIVSEGENIFADVDSIIMQHHEMPDGSGFPRGLRSLSISPLACIFIIASEFVEEVYDKKSDQINMEKIKLKFKNKFNKGNFKKPLEAFLKVF